MIVAVLFGLFTAIIWGVGDFLSRKPAEQIGAYLTSAYIQPIGLALMLGYSMISGTLSTELLVSNRLILVVNIAVGMIAFTAFVFLIKGYTEGVMSVVAPIAGSYPAVTVVLSVLILGTFLSEASAWGIVAVIIGIAISGVKLSEIRRHGRIDEEEKTKTRRKLTKGVDYGLIALVCSGFALFGLGIVAPVYGSILPVVVIKIVETTIAFLLVIPMKHRLRLPSRRVLFWLVLMGVLDVAGFITYNYGIRTAGTNIPIVVTLSGLIGIVTMLLAKVFYKERLEKIQSFGILIIFVGVATILYF